MTYYYDDELYHYDDELYHYGVKGMKWGIRKARRSIGNGISRIRRKASGFYNKHKRAINTAAGIAGAAALGYGAYRLDRATGGHASRALRKAGSRIANSTVGTTARDAYGQVRRGASNLYSRGSARYLNSNVHRTLASGRRAVGNKAHQIWRDTKIGARSVGSRVGSAARTYGGKAASGLRSVGSRVGSAARTYGGKAASGLRRVGTRVANSNIGTNVRDVAYSVGQRAGRVGRQAGVTAARTFNTARRKVRRAVRRG